MGRRVESVVIEQRFRGRPESANGGYVAGLLARELMDGIRWECA